MFNYFRVPQTSALSVAVSDFWQVDRVLPKLTTETIIPKGIVEVVFNFSEAPEFTLQLGQQRQRVPRCFINGCNSVPVELQLPDRQVFFGVVFHSVAIKEIFKVPAGELKNQCVDLTLLDVTTEALWQQMASRETFTDRVAIFSDWLQKRLPELSAQDQLLSRFLGNQFPEVRTVAELADLVCYSQRNLSRKLKALTGLNTEEALLYKKYLKSVGLVHQSELSLTEIAHLCHFSDQPHFTKTFNRLAQRSPREYRQTKAQVPGHIVQNGR